MSRGLRDQKGSEKEKYGKTMPPNQVLRLIETMYGDPPVHVSHASAMHRAELRRMRSPIYRSKDPARATIRSHEQPLTATLYVRQAPACSSQHIDSRLSTTRICVTISAVYFLYRFSRRMNLLIEYHSRNEPSPINYPCYYRSRRSQSSGLRFCTPSSRSSR